MTERWSLALRLIVFSLAASFVGTSVGGWLLRERLHDAVERSFEAQLRGRLETLVAQFESAGVQAARGHRLDQGEFGRIFSGWYWVLRAAGGTQQSRSGWDETLRTGQAHDLHGDGRLWALNDPTGRPLLGVVQRIALDGAPAEVHVFGPAEGLRQEQQRIDRILLTTQAALLAALGLLAVAVVRFSLRPLQRLRQRLDAVHAGQAPEVGLGFGPDLDPVAATVDQVLARNAEVVERAQHQAADLSHALKKPLAVLGMEARRPDVSGPWLRDQVQAMSRTIDRHLARFGSGVGGVEWVDVPAVLRRVATVMETIHGARALRWEIDLPSVDLPPEVPRWRGMASDLEEMLGNLLDNAGKWASRRVRVSLRAQPGQRIEVCVEDDGPGLPAEQMAQVVRRGQRFDEREGGHGLGLAIVRDIAEVHDGRLELGASALGGLRCVLRL